MVSFSSLRLGSLLRSNATVKSSLQRAMSDHRIFPLTPSRWQWIKFKDYLHYYFMLGLIPGGLIVMGANIFVGPATLQKIPDDYEPKYWEYYKSPITRFIARYLLTDPQQDYEKYLCYIFLENERKNLRALEADVKAKLAERSDYKAYYYRPVMAKYHRATREAAEYAESVQGN